MAYSKDCVREYVVGISLCIVSDAHIVCVW